MHARTLIMGWLVMAAAPVWADALTREAADEWLAAYGAAWEARDADRAAQLFTEDARYRVTPFEAPHEGREGVRAYWAEVTAGQANVGFEHELLSVEGDRAIAHWQAAFDVPASGQRLRLDGVFLLEFDASGLCSSLREWWHLESE